MMGKAMEDQVEAPAPVREASTTATVDTNTQPVQVSPERVTACQKDPKKVVASCRGAMVRKAKQEALLKQLRSVKADLSSAELTEAAPTHVDPVAVSGRGLSASTVDDARFAVPPWLAYRVASAVLVGAAVYVWWSHNASQQEMPPKAPRGQPDSNTLCLTWSVKPQLNTGPDPFYME